MKFSVQLPTDRVDAGEAFTTVDAIREIAVAAEASGYDACWVTEHPFPADAWLSQGGHHALDPFVSLTAAACATTTLRLHTNILVLPYRNPFLTAKAVASLDLLSGGRVIVGAAAGYLEGEYAALGADFDHRNERCDEALDAMKAAWSGESVHFEGAGFRADGNTMLPTPTQRPHPPIWIGGNSTLAIRRAAQHAQGWSPFPTPGGYASRARTGAIETVADLERGIVRLRAEAAKAGRNDTLDVNFVPFGARMGDGGTDFAALRDQIAELEGIGVNWITVSIPGSDRAGFVRELERFAAEVLP